jgi:hypothetical protein
MNLSDEIGATFFSIIWIPKESSSFETTTWNYKKEGS